MDESKPINIGIFGHIDHGKTTLLKQLTGKWADTHSEEMKRGITIKLGYADATIYKDKEYNINKKGKPIRHVTFVDSPGHEMLMATTLSGAALIDAAILVIAANEGIKPQTYEHLMTLQAKKVKNIIVAQNKIDLVPPEKARENYNEIKKLFEKNEPLEIIPISAQQGVNINELLKTIAQIKILEKKTNETPIFLIARSFDINKPGTKPKNLKGSVLGGVLKSGRLKINDEIEIKPGRTIKENNQTSYIPAKAKILGLFEGSEKREEILPGGSVSIETSLDMSLGRRDSLTGNSLSLVGKLPEPIKKIKLKYLLFPRVFGISEHIEIEKIKEGETLMLSINTSLTGGNVTKVEKEEIELSLKIPVVVSEGDNVGMGRNIRGHWRLIGSGEVIKK